MEARGHIPPSLVIEHDLLYLGMLCAFFCGDGRVGGGEEGEVVVGHGQRIAGAGLSECYIIQGIDYLGMSSMSDSL